MKTNSALIIAFVVMAGAGSCVVGQKLSFENKDAGPGYSVTKTATIVFQDQRSEVLSGKEKPSFCGHSNSSAQISYNIQTESGKPLADEFARSVSNAYGNAGANAGMLIVNMNTKPDSVLQVFNAGDKERLLFFTIRKWESRATPLFSSIRYEVIYYLELNVFNKQGELLASATTQDIVVKEQGAATSMKQMQAMADEVFKEQVKKLLSKEDVKKFL